jgi:hypothetical protein
MSFIGVSLEDQIRGDADSQHVDRPQRERREALQSRREALQSRREALQSIGMVSVAGIIGSVAFGVLGFSLVTGGGGIAAFIGAPLLLVSLPVGYAAYNCNMIARNLLEIVNNPSSYRTAVIGPLDRERLRSRLVQGTFFANWAIDMLLDELMADAQRGSRS